MINKKLFFLFALTTLTLLFTTSCDDDDDDIYGNWVKSYQVDGNKRCGAVSFVINETAYFGLGYNGSNPTGHQYLLDFYSYSGGTAWIPCDSFPGVGRQDAFAFSVGGKGYIGGGYYGDNGEVDEIYFDDVWEFDPTAPSGSQWTELDSVLPDPITEATAFVINDIGYYAGGRYESDIVKNSSYKFDTTTCSFSLVEGSTMAEKRAGAFSFVLDGKAYVGGGYDNSYQQGFEVFDPTTGLWNEGESKTILRDLYLDDDITDDIDHYDDEINLCRRWTMTIVLEGKGYIIGGNYQGSPLSDCWAYDPSTDLWTEKNSFEDGMNSRYSGNAFVLQGIPFVMSGYNGSSYFDDIWSFEPDADEDEND